MKSGEGLGHAFERMTRIAADESGGSGLIRVEPSHPRHPWRKNLLASARCAIFGLLLGIASPLLAHDDTTLDAMKAPNGGQLRMAGPYHLELVVVKDAREVREAPLVVHVTDHAGAKIPTAGASGKLKLLAGGISADVTLQPDGDNRLKGFAKYASDPKMKAIVSVTLAGKSAEQARFTPLEVK